MPKKGERHHFHCSTPGCTRTEKLVRGYCKRHYDEIRRTVGFPGQAKCQYPDCDMPAVENGFCKHHRYIGSSVPLEDRRCLWCGVILEDYHKTRRVCPTCASKVKTWGQGTWFVCVFDPGDPAAYRGGHISLLNIKQSLASGSLEEGLKFEKYVRREYRGAFIVVWDRRKKKCVLADITPGHKQKGDGFILGGNLTDVLRQEIGL